MNSLCVRILDDVNKKEWDKSLMRSLQGNLFQSSIYADFLREFFCYHPIYLVAEDKAGKLKGSLLLFKGVSSTKKIALMPFKKVLSRLLVSSGYQMLTWRGGPVAYDYTDYPEILGAFLNFIDKLSRKCGIRKIRLATLPFYGLDTSLSLECLNKFINIGYREKKKATVLIDLSQPENILWDNLKKTSRYDVNRAKEDEIEISISANAQDLTRYYPDYKKACFRNKILPNPRKMLSYMLNNRGRIFIAWHNKKPIAGALTIEFNGIADQHYLWNSNYAMRNKLFAMHLITWSMIEYYKKQGCRFLDLAGINLKDTRSAKEEGIFNFKSRWGGKIIEFMEFNKVGNFKL